MRVIALQYHDVIDGGAWESSGFPGDDAATYKMSAADFAGHVRAVSGAAPPHPDGVLDLLAAPSRRRAGAGTSSSPPTT